jgi:hypothetical protein
MCLVSNKIEVSKMEEEQCGCCSSDECCSSESQCGCECHEESLDEKMERIANDAWEVVVRKAMEAEIEKEDGPGIKKVAKIVVDHVRKVWQMKMQNEKLEESEFEAYQKKLMDAMSK